MSSSIGSTRSYASSRRSAGFQCNSCSKPMSTTVFVCSCDCAFCEECTYSHFNSSSACPSCNRNLNPDDFMELVVADPTAASQQALKNTFQTLFTKFEADSELCQQDMCHRLLKSLDNDKRAVRFLMKQFMLHGKKAGSQSGNIERAFASLKKQFIQLKQSANSQKLQADQTIADLQHRLNALQSAVDDKENQLQKFRQMYAREGMARIPSSSHSTGSNSHGSRGSNDGHRMQRSNTPPLQAYILQKQVREREKEQSVGLMTRRNIHGPDVNAIITPIQPPTPHHLVRQSVDSALSPGTSPRNSGYGFSTQRGHSRSSGQPPFAQKRRSSYGHSNNSSSNSGYNFSTSHRR